MSQPMDRQDALQMMLPIIDAFDRLGIAYRVGGSVASSFYGQFRATHDVDLIADIQMQHVVSFVAAFDPNDYLVVDQSIVDAIIHQSSFNIIDLRTMNKIDVFIQQQTPFARQGQQRAQQVVLTPGARPLWVTASGRYDPSEDPVVARWWRNLDPTME